jgi:cystathionine gamma-lyase
MIRSTLTPVVSGEPLHAGPVFAGPYHAPGDPAGIRYSYGRSHNPSWTVLEAALGELESGEGFRAEARVFASGMAACMAVFGVVLRPGDVAVLPSQGYFASRGLVEGYFSEMGVRVRRAPTAGEAQGEVLEGARLLWLETPSNPWMEVCDVRAWCARAHGAGAAVAVDNTTVTALGQKPLALGADFSVASDGKSLTGHSDLMVGHVAVRDAEWLGKIDGWRNATGGIVGPMEAWLTLRSMATLPLRLERSSANALAVAEYLKTRPEVLEVLYPGLPEHPGHGVAERQMRFFGCVLGFVLGGKTAAERFLGRAALVTEATSFGGMCTTAERRARWGSDAVGEGFVRMSVGCEAVEDLIADLGQALDGLA